jgi:hypothetical protein
MYKYQIPEVEILDKTFTLELALATASDVLDKTKLLKNKNGKISSFFNEASKLIFEKSNLKDQNLKEEDVQELPITVLQALTENCLGKNLDINITEKGGFIKKFDIDFELIDGNILEIKEAKTLSTRKFNTYSENISLINKDKLNSNDIKTYYNTLASIIKNETSLVDGEAITTKLLYEKTPVAVLDKVAGALISDSEINIQKKTN